MSLKLHGLSFLGNGSSNVCLEPSQWPERENTQAVWETAEQRMGTERRKPDKGQRNHPRLPEKPDTSENRMQPDGPVRDHVQVADKQRAVSNSAGRLWPTPLQP